ncbi:hypothetical protein HYU16_00895 [Candidatus Woesearchaeota archaeon]|nr:hypothetical protein [Candidatus Woesearchaeota archaeon]
MASFRLFFISVVLLVAIISVSANAAAAEKAVKITKVSAVQNSEALVTVSLDSQRKNTDSKVTVSVPELGLRASRNVDFARANKKTVHLEIPSPGMFDPFVRIVFSSDGGRRVKHRPLILQ